MIADLAGRSEGIEIAVLVGGGVGDRLQRERNCRFSGRWGGREIAVNTCGRMIGSTLCLGAVGFYGGNLSEHTHT